MTTKMVPLKQIDIPPDNRDQIAEDALQELAATMDKHGLLEPIIVRPTKKNRYELVAGERRLRASQILKWKEIEAKEMAVDDEQAAAIHAIENLQRVDLTPWEHARKLAPMLNGHSIEDLAVRLGRSARWVAIHLAIGKLIPELVQLVKEQDWPLGHLPLLARIPRERQPDILQAIRDAQDTDYEDDWSFFDHQTHRNVPHAPSLRVLEEFLSEYWRRLDGTPWKKDDAELLPQAGACTTCPKRSGAQSLLFPELSDPKLDTCLDEGCWKAKQAAFVALSVEKLTKSDKKPPVLLASYDTTRVTEEVKQALGPVEFKKAYDYVDCKKTEKGAVRAIVVDGDQGGTVKYVKPLERGGAAAATRADRPVDPDTGERAPPSAEERQENLRLKRQCAAAERWREKMQELKVGIDVVLPLLVWFGTDDKRPHRGKWDWVEFAERKTPPEDDAWGQLILVFQQRAQRHGPMSQGAEIWDECRAQAEALKQMSALEACWQEACKSVPLPKVMQEEGIQDSVAMP